MFFRKSKPAGPVDFLIVGLGNPGKKYEGTRHNAGFAALEALAGKLGVKVNRSKYKALTAEAAIGDKRVLLMMPQTFMNLSGESIREVLEYYKAEPEDLIVIYDDISLVPGQIRVRGKGSAGGHNGVKNIILQLATQEFPRIRVGVGEKPARMDLADYVLGHFNKEDREAVDEAEQDAAKAAACILEHGVEAAMNAFNAKKK